MADLKNKYDAFISYSTRDKNVADALCHYLEQNKIRCWIAPRNILPGMEYAEVIDKAISQVTVFIVIYSEASANSKWVHKETNLAVSDGKIIIPFRIEDYALENTGMRLYLNDQHWIDAIPNPEDFFETITEAVKRQLDIDDCPDEENEDEENENEENENEENEDEEIEGEAIAFFLLLHCVILGFISPYLWNVDAWWEYVLTGFGYLVFFALVTVAVNIKKLTNGDELDIHDMAAALPYVIFITGILAGVFMWWKFDCGIWIS